MERTGITSSLSLLFFLVLLFFFSVLILKRGASVVVIAQRGFDPPAACDEYSAADTHSPRLSLLVHANVASLSFHQHDASFFFYKKVEVGTFPPPSWHVGGRGTDASPGLL